MSNNNPPGYVAESDVDKPNDELPPPYESLK